MDDIKRYLLFIWGDVEPSLISEDEEQGFKTDEARDKIARELKEEHGDE